MEIENNFKPEYREVPGKEQIIAELRQAAEKADTVYLATDPDREGEAISWHLKELLGLSEAEIDECVKEAIEMVGLDYEKVKNVSPFELSGGQKRRAAIAGVIAMKPEVLILDEPTAGLNPKAHADILNMVETIHRKSKNIIFLVSHNMNDIASMSDKVLVMNNGRLVMDGTPAEVFSREEELKSMGLALPDSMEIMMRLKKAGMDINTDCLTMDEAAEEIAKVLAK